MIRVPDRKVAFEAIKNELQGAESEVVLAGTTDGVESDPDGHEAERPRARRSNRGVGAFKGDATFGENGSAGDSQSGLNWKGVAPFGEGDDKIAEWHGDCSWSEWGREVCEQVGDGWMTGKEPLMFG